MKQKEIYIHKFEYTGSFKITKTITSSLQAWLIDLETVLESLKRVAATLVAAAAVIIGVTRTPAGISYATTTAPDSRRRG